MVEEGERTTERPRPAFRPESEDKRQSPRVIMAHRERKGGRKINSVCTGSNRKNGNKLHFNQSVFLSQSVDKT